MSIKKSLAVFSLVMSIGLPALANEVETFTVIKDNYGNGDNRNYFGDSHLSGRDDDDVIGGSTYQVSALTTERRTVNGSTYLDVYVDTNFTAQYSNDRGGIDYGDLFITTGDLYNPAANSSDDVTFSPTPDAPGGARVDDLSSDTRWQYAFDLDNANDRWGSIGSSGKLVELKTGGETWEERAYANSLMTANEFNTNRDGRKNQVVKVRDYVAGQTWDGGNYIQTVSSGAGNSWSNNIGGGQNGANNRITFSFEVTGTILATAEQLAFRWAMTCANDIIEGLASVKPGKPNTPVPEPATVAMLLLALAYMLINRRKSASINNFNA